jgi:hypothetical protein
VFFIFQFCWRFSCEFCYKTHKISCGLHAYDLQIFWIHAARARVSCLNAVVLAFGALGDSNLAMDRIRLMAFSHIALHFHHFLHMFMPLLHFIFQIFLNFQNSFKIEN